MKKREFGEGPLYVITNYVYWFLLGNIYFLLLNIPFLFVLMAYIMKPVEGFAILFFITSVLIGPAFLALLSSMGKIVRDKDIQFTKHFFKAYKSNFLEGIFYWILYSVIIMILYFDITFVSTNYNSILMIRIVQIVAIFFISYGLFVFPIVARFYFKTKDILRISSKYFIRKIHIAISNTVITIALIYLAFTFNILILFVFSIICFSIMFFQNNVLLEIENSLKENKDKDKNNI
jgi:uncharacterized membrane protein YesL